MLKCNLRLLMAKNKIDNIVDLMNKADISRNSANKMYREHELESIKLETLIKICDSLKCPLSDLIEYIPED